MSDDTEATAGWAGYRRLVLEGLERIERRVSDIDIKIDRKVSDTEAKFDKKNDEQDKAIQRLEVEVGKLKVWATLSGTIAGAIVAAVAQFLFKVPK